MEMQVFHQFIVFLSPPELLILISLEEDLLEKILLIRWLNGDKALYMDNGEFTKKIS